MRFDSKVTFVTGGGIGLGRAVARAFVAEGAAVAIAEIDDDQAAETAAALRASGGHALAVHCDVAKETEVADAVTKVEAELGGVDVVVNNAALHLTKYNQPFSKLGRDEFRQLLDVNVVGVVNCTLACRESMGGRGSGAVVNIASNMGFMSSTPYGVSKLAVRGLTVALAKELAADGIRVNCVAPGLMDTENALVDLPQQTMDDIVQNRQLLHRKGRMDDIVASVLFLCSEDASFITGETLRVTGGYPTGV